MTGPAVRRGGQPRCEHLTRTRRLPEADLREAEHHLAEGPPGLVAEPRGTGVLLRGERGCPREIARGEVQTGPLETKQLGPAGVPVAVRHRERVAERLEHRAPFAEQEERAGQEVLTGQVRLEMERRRAGR